MALVLAWPLAPADIHLEHGAVHIWSAGLQQSAAQMVVFWESLTVAERDRADRFHFDRHRRRFIVARGLLRHLLGRYLGLEPHAVRLDFSAYDKPFLPENPLFFNLSHTGDVGLFAFCLDTAVGVDVEKIKPLDDLDAIAARFFAPGEYQVLQSLPLQQQTSAFFRCWTRKEAFIKLIGEGLSYPLDNFEVTLAINEPARFVSIEGSAVRAAAYHLEHLELARGYVGALAVQTGQSNLFFWRWSG
ncbi:MAG: 4'-phosphopantetheinyl transferase superfamily protein [Anaerolineales bacterium]|nr:4'-phosphopantetheinyl transferase superfamily protein [Anaerolineales bacterium]